MNGGIILRIEHISKNFGAIRAVDDVSLDILDGEMHAIIGSNGAGKSTLMDLVCRRSLPPAKLSSAMRIFPYCLHTRLRIGACANVFRSPSFSENSKRLRMSGSRW